MSVILSAAKRNRRIQGIPLKLLHRDPRLRSDDK